MHQLLELGYRRLDPAALSAQDEPVITGELARAMNAAIDDQGSPSWAHFFQVDDEQPVNDGVRMGKYRKRIDIGVRSSLPRPRHHFSFEAKVLSRRHPLRNYLGATGLQCFLSGDYAANERDAGMLGYVQQGTEEEWAASLQRELREASAKHGVCDGCCGEEQRFPAGPTYTYRSRHLRSRKSGAQIEIFHTFLSFRQLRENAPGELPGG